MPDEVKTAATKPPEPEPVEWTDFLAERPPGATAVRVLNAVVDYRDGKWTHQVDFPRITIECGGCGGPRAFIAGDLRFMPTIGNEVPYVDLILVYRCVNCREYQKRIAVSVFARGNTHKELIYATKLGEHPPFGDRIPARVLEFVGEDRDAFLKGRRAENQGLGIGAFAYYRRVVEDQKGRILDKIIDVANRTGAKAEVIEALTRAKSEIQFSKAIDQVKDLFPSALLLNGQNPLTLLHGPLSGGLHERSDEECLELATAIRVVLFALAERVSAVLKDDNELKRAVSRLQNPKPKSQNNPST